MLVSRKLSITICITLIFLTFYVFIPSSDEPPRLTSHSSSIQITLIQFSDQATLSTLLGSENHYRYAERHSYQIVSWYGSRVVPSAYPQLSVQYDKIVLLLQILAQKPSGWLFWIDTDAYIMNMTIRVDDLIQSYLSHPNASPTTSLIIAAENNDLLNTGVMFVRSCPWSRNFFSKLLDEASKQEFLHHDQGAIIHQLCAMGQLNCTSTKPPHFSSEFIYAQERDFNSALNNWKPGDFISHSYGLSPAMKLEAYSWLLKKYFLDANPRHPL